MQYEEKYSEELINHIKEWAKESYDCGQPMDCDDIDEFQHILNDDGFSIDYKQAQELYNLYTKEFDLCRERYS